MVSVITLSLVVMAGLIAFSQFFTFSKDAESETVKFRYMIFTFSITASALIEVSMSLAYGTTICFILYGLDKFVKAVIMGEIVLLTKDMVDINPKFISAFISIVSYAAVALFFVDILAQGGTMSKSRFGVYFSPVHAWHHGLYFLYYMFYLIILITFVVYRSAVVIHNREKYDLKLLLFVYIFGAFGFLAEQFIISNSVEFFPMSVFSNLVSAVILRKLLIYHESILVKASHFEKELDPGRTDVVFIVDDKLNVIFQNKRAQVLEVMYEDKFMGRKITDVFQLTEGAYSLLLASPDENAFGISADYEPGDRHVNMIVNHKIDRYGEILASVIYVYNMEELEKSDNHVIEMNEITEERMLENAVSITKDARVLVVDDDVLFLNVFQRILKPYEVFVTRAINGKDALDQISNHIYDIIFISYEMDRNGGGDIVRKIRSMPGDYARLVPIVFLTSANINDVFTGFLEAGFNDYLTKPVSKRALNSVLTRWLWQRFDEKSKEEVDDGPFSSQYQELNELLIDAEKMYEQQKLDMLRFILNGIKRNSKKLGLTDISDLSSSLDEAIEFGDFGRISQLFEKMRMGIRDAITVK